MLTDAVNLNATPSAANLDDVNAQRHFDFSAGDIGGITEIRRPISLCRWLRHPNRTLDPRLGHGNSNCLTLR